MDCKEIDSPKGWYTPRWHRAYNTVGYVVKSETGTLETKKRREWYYCCQSCRKKMGETVNDHVESDDEDVVGHMNGRRSRMSDQRPRPGAPGPESAADAWSPWLHVSL